jgi:hypothetical protein
MSSIRKLRTLGISIFAVTMVLGLLVVSANGQGRGRGRDKEWKKCEKFVNCHDARDGRVDGRGPNRDRFDDDRFDRDRRFRNGRFDRDRDWRNRDWRNRDSRNHDWRTRTRWNRDWRHHRDRRFEDDDFRRFQRARFRRDR